MCVNCTMFENVNTLVRDVFANPRCMVEFVSYTNTANATQSGFLDHFKLREFKQSLVKLFKNLHPTEHLDLVEFTENDTTFRLTVERGHKTCKFIFVKEKNGIFTVYRYELTEEPDEDHRIHFENHPTMFFDSTCIDFIESHPAYLYSVGRAFKLNNMTPSEDAIRVLCTAIDDLYEDTADSENDFYRCRYDQPQDAGLFMGQRTCKLNYINGMCNITLESTGIGFAEAQIGLLEFGFVDKKTFQPKQITRDFRDLTAAGNFMDKSPADKFKYYLMCLLEQDTLVSVKYNKPTLNIKYFSI